MAIKRRWHNHSERQTQVSMVLNRHWPCIQAQALVKTLSQHLFYAPAFQQDNSADMAATLTPWQHTVTSMHTKCTRIKQQFNALTYATGI